MDGGALARELIKKINKYEKNKKRNSSTPKVGKCNFKSELVLIIRKKYKKRILDTRNIQKKVNNNF